MKVCTKCKRELIDSAFYPSGYQRADGTRALRSVCKKCSDRDGRHYNHMREFRASDERSSLLDELSQDEEFRSLLINLGK